MMTFMQDSNKLDFLKEENEDNKFSFSFSLSEEENPSPSDILEKAKKYLQEILNSRFSDYEKRKILPKHERLNFACPYCGDSHTDVHKKRGNIYTQSLFYKCYNCGIYRNLISFLKDFKKTLDTNSELAIREINENSIKNESRYINPAILYDVDNLKQWAIDREEIEQRYNLKTAAETPIATYLKKRLQPDISKFSWGEKKQQLYIFHMIPGTHKVIGYQIRNFKSVPKYLTFKLSRIYEDFEKPISQEILEIDEISSTFGILEMNINQPVSVFEGPLDSFLYKNSIATCSSNIDPPLEANSFRFFYDYDAPGREAALEKLNVGVQVFLWKKLLHDLQVSDPIKKMDLTDLLILAKRKNIKLPRLSSYFSNDKYDAYWI